jgi:hypothetical protein
MQKSDLIRSHHKLLFQVHCMSNLQADAYHQHQLQVAIHCTYRSTRQPNKLFLKQMGILTLVYNIAKKLTKPNCCVGWMVASLGWQRHQGRYHM